MQHLLLAWAWAAHQLQLWSCGLRGSLPYLLPCPPCRLPRSLWSHSLFVLRLAAFESEPRVVYEKLVDLLT